MTPRSTHTDLILLAPMEGVMDWRMRDLVTGYGGYDLCVSEFIRVVDQLLPRRTYERLCPELTRGSRTGAGTPMRVQLLGQSPEHMAENAARAVAMGSPGIDLNFGCPAKTVNRHKGGAALLATPHLIHDIVSAVRARLGPDVPVTAKMRLGCEDAALAIDNAQAIETAGAAWLVVHGRTRAQGYRPPVDWEAIGRVADAVSLRVIANGDINNPEDYHRVRDVSGCRDVMVGRGVLATPNLACVLRGDSAPLPWSDIVEALLHYASYPQSKAADHYLTGRLKQWLKNLVPHYPEADALFTRIRQQRAATPVLQCIQESRARTADVDQTVSFSRANLS
ncbi:MAG: tRNA-dihydrouridine synthase [Pseudomonadota bacterium]